MTNTRLKLESEATTAVPPGIVQAVEGLIAPYGWHADRLLNPEGESDLPEKLLTVEAVAKRLAVSKRSVFRWIKQGRMQAVHLGRRATRISAGECRRFVGELDKTSAQSAEGVPR